MSTMSIWDVFGSAVSPVPSHALLFPLLLLLQSFHWPLCALEFPNLDLTSGPRPLMQELPAAQVSSDQPAGSGPCTFVPCCDLHRWCCQYYSWSLALPFRRSRDWFWLRHTCWKSSWKAGCDTSLWHKGLWSAGEVGTGCLRGAGSQEVPEHLFVCGYRFCVKCFMILFSFSFSALNQRSQKNVRGKG